MMALCDRGVYAWGSNDKGQVRVHVPGVLLSCCCVHPVLRSEEMTMPVVGSPVVIDGFVWVLSGLLHNTHR